MANELAEAAHLATSFALVAVPAAFVGLVAFALRPKGEALVPAWRAFPVPWGGFEVALAFVAVSFLVPLTVLEVLDKSGFYDLVYGDEFVPQLAPNPDAQQKSVGNTLRLLWATLFATPIALAALALTRYTFYPKWRPRPSGSTAGKVALAVCAWAVVAPAVLALNATVNLAAQALGVPPDTHSLAKLGGRPVGDQVLLAVEACVGAPLREELLIRGAMLWWCVGRLRGAPAPLATARPWWVMTAAGFFAATGGKWQPVALAAVLTVGLAVLWQYKRTGARRARAVYATAAFFALLHPVWPNPVPLFALGLALGWLAVRTNGLLVPVLVHALFNAVSVVLVLRT